MEKSNDLTIYDLARELKVSSSTVSRALRDDPRVTERTRKRIKELAEKKGFRANFYARNLRTHRTNTIGLLVHELHSDFIGSVLAGIERILAAAGYNLIVANSMDSLQTELKNVRNLLDRCADGLIASLSPETKNLDHLLTLPDKGVPVVLLNNIGHPLAFPTVAFDYYDCGRMATLHLVAQGCRRIVHMTGPLTRSEYGDRCRGYRDALQQSGLPADSELLIVNDLGAESVKAAAEKIAAMHPLPDGLFVSDDYAAAICMRTLKEHGLKVPQDIAVVGFNNDRIGVLTEPALTTMWFPGVQLGELAAKDLLNRLGPGGARQPITITMVRSELLIRQSSLHNAGNRTANE